MGTENDDLPASDELKHLESALRKCKDLEQTLRLSLVQVMLLNRKYSAPLSDPVSTDASKSLFKAHSLTTTPNRKDSDEFYRNESSENLRLRISASSPFLNPFNKRRFTEGPRPMQIYRSLNSIVINSNEINVQVIKIRRHFEGVLVRVEYLVRMYCRNLRWKGMVTRTKLAKSGPVRETMSLPNFKSHHCCGSAVKGRC